MKNIEVPEGARGPRGLRGADGNDFNFDDHKEAILQLIVSKIPSKIELTEEQKLELKGDRGPAGRDGQDGQDGKSFVFEEHLADISKIIEEHSLTFDKLNEDQIALLRGPKGRDGVDGQDGKSFVFEEHVTDISKIIEEHSLTFDKLTDDQIALLRGPKGRDGQDGPAGKDFVFEEHADKISYLIEEHSLTFDKLTDDQIALLRGPEGRRGRDGKDFDFAESQDAINDLIVSYLTKVRDTLALKFNDLTEDQVASLKGARGQRGKPGKDFDFDENKEKISGILSQFLEEKTPELKLKFSDLTEADKFELKLKFEHLTDEERFSLKGARGQRGRPGPQGEEGPQGSAGLSAYALALHNGFIGTEAEWLESLKGKTGARGPVGMPGVVGRTGQAGRDGVDGQDAPVVEDVRLKKDGDDISFEFRMSNGVSLYTNYVTLPKGKVSQYITNIVGGGGGGSGNGKSAYELARDNGFSGTLQDFLDSLKGDKGDVGDTGADGQDGQDGQAGADGKSAYAIAVDNGFTGSESDFLTSLKGDKGDKGDTGDKGDKGDPGVDGTNGIDGTNGVDGQDGKSAFEIAQDNGFVGTEADWLASLKGADGTGGAGASDLTIIDETTQVSTHTKKITFVGEFVRVTPVSNMSQWPDLNAVPSLDSFSDASTDEVIVKISPPDSSVIRGVPSVPETYVGAFVRMTNEGIAVNAIADAYVNANVIGIVESKPSSNVCDIRVSGISSDIFTGLDTSKDYFLSDVTPGSLSETIPVTSGHIKLRLGQAFSGSKFLFAKGDRVERA